MRLPLILLGVLALLGAGSVARAGDEPESLTLARRAVDAVRGDAHKEKMRVDWPAMEDETPPDGAEVVIVRGYASYEITRMVLRSGKVEAGSVYAAQSWFYNQENGESFGASEFDVDAAQFVLAWNATRRIVAASDARLEPEPADHPRRSSTSLGTHESVDWIRVSGAADRPPIHCADGARRTREWDGVRRWSGLRDEAAFDLFEKLLPTDKAVLRAVPFERWSDFATSRIRAAATSPTPDAVDRDRAFLATCLRVIGVAGGVTAEEDVAALDAALARVANPGPWMDDVREEVACAATRLRVRHRFDREDIIRTLRSAPSRTWAHGDQKEWLRRVFREKDPAGWVRFLLDEATSEWVRSDHVAAAAAELKSLPAADAVPALRALLERADPYIRLEAALSLHAIDAKSEDAKSAIVKLALDRSIACDKRSDLTNHWSRERALAAALEWGGLDRKTLRAHVLAPEPEDEVFLESARSALSGTPEALTSDALCLRWRGLLDHASAEQVLMSIRSLVAFKDVEWKKQMLAALDRLGAPSADSVFAPALPGAEELDRLRGRVLRLGATDDPR